MYLNKAEQEAAGKAAAIGAGVATPAVVVYEIVKDK